MIGRIALLSLALASLVPGLGRGHGLDPVALALRETAPGVFDVQWRTSATRIPGADVRPVLPGRCHRRQPSPRRPRPTM